MHLFSYPLYSCGMHFLRLIPTRPHVYTNLFLFRIEILEDCPEVDCVLVPVGGGGLIGGIARYIKQVRPSVEVRGIYLFPILVYKYVWLHHNYVQSYFL